MTLSSGNLTTAIWGETATTRTFESPQTTTVPSQLAIGSRGELLSSGHGNNPLNETFKGGMWFNQRLQAVTIIYWPF